MIIEEITLITDKLGNRLSSSQTGRAILAAALLTRIPENTSHSFKIKIILVNSFKFSPMKYFVVIEREDLRWI